MSQLIQQIETADFKSELLQTLQAHFITNEATASYAINKLAYRLSQLDVRYNPFVFF